MLYKQCQEKLVWLQTILFKRGVTKQLIPKSNVLRTKNLFIIAIFYFILKSRLLQTTSFKYCINFVILINSMFKKVIIAKVNINHGQLIWTKQWYEFRETTARGKSSLRDLFSTDVGIVFVNGSFVWTSSQIPSPISY